MAKHNMAPNGSPENILGIWGQAEDNEIELGAHWYERAHQEVVWLAEKYGLTIPEAAGVVAVLSPGTKWSKNLYDAEALMKDSQAKVTSWGSNRFKATMILLTNTNLEIVIRGHKVQAFWNLLCDPGCGDLVVDGHALSIWLGKYHPVGYYTGWHTSIKQVVQADYYVAANHLGVVPHILQATTWVVAHRLWDIK